MAHDCLLSVSAAVSRLTSASFLAPAPAVPQALERRNRQREAIREQEDDEDYTTSSESISDDFDEDMPMRGNNAKWVEGTAERGTGQGHHRTGATSAGSP